MAGRMPKAFASASRRVAAPGWNIPSTWTEPNAKDDLIERDGARVWIEPSAVLYLLGTELGFETTTLRSGFTFTNPNQTSACGCGESVELKPADLAALAAQRQSEPAHS